MENLIADSGSTKTTWCLGSETFQTAGLNPYHQSMESIAATLRTLPEEMRTAESIFFYGSGCTHERSGVLEAALRQIMPQAAVSVASDLLGAARALLQHQRGIACILGTGSNSCLYDGEKIVENISPLGYILGDEGSGAVIGRHFVGDCLKNQVPAELRTLFLKTYHTMPAEIVEHVYRGEQPNRYLASFMPFLSENIENFDYINTLIVNCFNEFFQRNVLQYADAQRLPVSFVGSVAHHFQKPLREAAAQFGLQVGKIERSPIKGLTTFHLSSSN
jgi:glucosamine kinase